MKQLIIVLLVLVLLPLFRLEAQNGQKPCTANEIHQFDFWVGEWDLTWNDTSHGTNKIDRLFGNCGVHENFFDPAMSYKGESWSVFNPNSKTWQQTWVDNQGGYIALSGNFENGEMKLSTQPGKIANGKEMISRMVYFNILSNSFDWRWEATTDQGATWKTNWLIHYKRRI
ncbi:MAG: hypothetical protein ABJA57_09070 [Ginsengibacter sp.]